MDVHDYPCPKCGSEGPHVVLAHEGVIVDVACGDTLCAAKFRIDPDTDD